MMDPDVTVARMYDESLSDDDRIEACRALMAWLADGGFAPSKYVDRGEAWDDAWRICWRLNDPEYNAPA